MTAQALGRAKLESAAHDVQTPVIAQLSRLSKPWRLNLFLCAETYLRTTGWTKPIGLGETSAESHSTPKRTTRPLWVVQPFVAPFSGPWREAACDHLLPFWPAGGETCLDNVHLCLHYPRRCRQATSASEVRRA